ncbi:MAG: hypothetical protein WBC44_14830 [Planctomycetaceae bacterium]
MINRVADVTAPGNGRRRLIAKTAPATNPPGRPSRGDLGKRLETCIGDHPVLSLTLGLTLGIVIGCLIKRR